VDIMLKPYALDALSKSMAKAVKTAQPPETFARHMTTPVMAA
jgi:hypothetical protein